MGISLQCYFDSFDTNKPITEKIKNLNQIERDDEN